MGRTRLLWALAALNAVLLVGLVWKLGGENVARANTAAARGDYVMIPARVPGGGFENGVVWTLDQRAGLLSAFTFDSNRKALNVMDPIDLNRLFTGAQPIGKSGGA
jgi:hypothetical protein